MFYKVKLLFAIMLAIFTSMILSSCSGVDSAADVYESFTDYSYKTTPIFSVEPTYATTYRLEVVENYNVTVFIGTTELLEVTVFDGRGSKMDVLPAGYEMRWSVEEKGQAYVEVFLTSTVGPVGTAAWVGAIQSTDSSFLITAQLYGLGDSDFGHIIPIDGAFAFFEVSAEYLYHKKIIFHINIEGNNSYTIRFLGWHGSTTDPKTHGSSESGGYIITFSPERRITIRGGTYHILEKHFNGHRNEDPGLSVTVFPGDEIWVSGPPELLNDLPEFLEDTFRRSFAVRNHLTGFGMQVIEYDEKETSALWNWIVANDIPIEIHDNELYQISIQEITGSLWDDFRIQAFVYGGDITLVSQRGILSQMSELYEDSFYFGFNLDNRNPGFEIQYILYHEIPYSSLLRALGK